MGDYFFFRVFSEGKFRGEIRMKLNYHNLKIDFKREVREVMVFLGSC